MKLTIYGAAQQVTGSMYLLQLDDYNILIDCGLNYEPEFQREHNSLFPFDPAEIDVVILTHAHLDHSGNIPTLIRKGFTGSILCTEPTLTLCELLLVDSASLEAKRVQRSHKSKKKNGGGRLYGHGEVRTAINSMVTLPFNQRFELNNQATLTFIPAGHILGAASVILDIKEGRKSKRIVFTGDLGNTNSEITVDPQIPEDVDVLVMESTYGSRFHSDTGSGMEVLKKQIDETCIAGRGRLLIPAFSVGRTQAILYTLNRMFRSNMIPTIKVFADSPMGITSSEIHSNHKEYLNHTAKAFLDEHGDLFRYKQLYVIEDKEDIEFMERCQEPCIIVSSAGMLEGGRIQKHVRNNLLHPSSTILIAGYCTPGTLGHKLLEGQRQVRIQKHDVPVFARIDRTDAFSAHPDQHGLLSYVQQVVSSKKPELILLTHGDPDSQLAFKDALLMHEIEANIPEIGDSYAL